MKRFLPALFIFTLLMAPRIAAAEDEWVRLFLGPDCAGCETFVLEALARNEGVKIVDIDFRNEWILVLFDNAVASVDRLVKTLQMFGYLPVVIPGEGA